MEKIYQFLYKGFNIIKTYPLVLAAALITVISLILFNHLDFYNYENLEIKKFLYLKIAFVSGLGISILYALTLLGERLHKKFIPLIGVVFLVGYYFLVFPQSENEMYIFHIIILALSALLSHLLVAFLPFINQNTEEYFWEYNKKLFVNTLTTLIFSSVLTGGILLALFAIEKLFNVHVNHQIYSQITLFLMIFGSCIIFLLLNNGGLNYLESKQKYPIVLKFFSQFILIPLLFVYLIILYFYSLKILIDWSIPKGFVTYLVVVYSLIGILALLLVYPLKEKKAKSWVHLFSKIFYISLLPLIGLLFASILLRVNQYGFTEKRYFILAIALWLAGIAIYFILRKNPKIKVIPISLFTIGLGCLTLPYLNVFSTSERSQFNELTLLLKQNNLLRNEKINFDTLVVDSTINKVYQKISYLHKRKLNHKISSLVSENKKPEIDSFLDKNYWYKIDFHLFFKNRIITNTERKKSFKHTSINSIKRPLNITKYDLLIDNLYSGEYEYDGAKIIINNKHYITLSINKNNETKTFSTLDYLEKLKEKYTHKRRVNLDSLSLKFRLNNYECKLIFNHINIQDYPKKSSETMYYMNDGYLLIKKLKR